MQSLCKLEETSDWNTVKDNVAQSLTGKTGGKQAAGSDGCPPREGSLWNWHARNIQSEVFVVGIRRKSSSSCISASCRKSVGLSGKFQHLGMTWEAKVKNNLCQTTLCIPDSVVDLYEPWSHVRMCLSDVPGLERLKEKIL